MSGIIKNQTQLEERLTKLTLDTAERLGLSWLRLKVAFDTRRDDEEGSSTAICEELGDWEYRQATIRWNLREASYLSDDDLLCTVIHELVHAMTEPLWGSLSEKTKIEFAKFNELGTENVTRAILALLG